MLIDAIWTDGAEYVDENALSVTIGRLRKKPLQNEYKLYMVSDMCGGANDVFRKKGYRTAG